MKIRGFLRKVRLCLCCLISLGIGGCAIWKPVAGNNHAAKYYVVRVSMINRETMPDIFAALASDDIITMDGPVIYPAGNGGPVWMNFRVLVRSNEPISRVCMKLRKTCADIISIQLTNE